MNFLEEFRAERKRFHLLGNRSAIINTILQTITCNSVVVVFGTTSNFLVFPSRVMPAQCSGGCAVQWMVSSSMEGYHQYSGGISSV